MARPRGLRLADKKRGRQGDKETRRKGEEETGKSNLLVSLSPCPLVIPSLSSQLDADHRALELQFGAVEIYVFAPRRQASLCALFRALGALDIYFFRLFGHVRQDGDAIRGDFDETAADMHPPVFMALPVREDAGLQLRDQRGVVGQYSQLPAKAGRNYFIDLLEQDQPFGRDYFEIELVCHSSGGWWLVVGGWRLVVGYLIFNQPPGARRHPRSLHLLRRFDHFVNRPLEEESLFRDVVVLAVHDLTETADRLFEGHQLAFQAGELRRHEERL